MTPDQQSLIDRVVDNSAEDAIQRRRAADDFACYPRLTMRLRIAAAVDLVEVFEARLVGDQEETLACTHGSTMRSAEAQARMMNTDYAVGARRIEVGAQSVPRFRVAVVDTLDRWMYLAHGTTPQQARVRAEFWIAREPADVH
jgi:hypothetical protein